MTTKTINVKVKVYIDEMLDFFQCDKSYGTLQKPYPTQSFYELVAPYAKFTGPLKDILVFENETVYKWKIESESGSVLNFVDLNGDSQFDIQMITSSPSQAKWDKVIKDSPKMDDDGKIKFKPKEKAIFNSEERSKKEFIFETTSSIPEDAMMKYSILFEFKDKKGNLNYGLIDPWTQSGSKPPPP